MTIASVRRWQWIVLGIVVGFLLRTVRDLNGANLGQFGDAINDPLRFERALATTIAERPAFKDVRVYRQVIRDDAGGESRAVHVVTGKYCNGEIDSRDGGYHWRPAVFIAPIPYGHASYLPDILGTEAVARYEAIPSPTVLSFLEALSADKGTHYTHAWWDSYPTVTWFGGSVVLIGVVWPTVINLLVFGKLVRPRTEKGTDLRKVRASVATSGPALGAQDDLEQLQRLEVEMQARLEAGLDVPTSASSKGAPPPIVKLESAPVEPAMAIDAGAKEFAAKPDDFYPTERRSSDPADGAAATGAPRSVAPREDRKGLDAKRRR
jgi:hypothetical protein